MSAGTIACWYWTWRRGGCVGAASLPAGLSAFAGFLPSFAGFAAWAGACFGAGFAALSLPFSSLPDLESLLAMVTSDVHDFAVGLEETDLARRGLALRREELE